MNGQVKNRAIQFFAALQIFAQVANSRASELPRISELLRQGYELKAVVRQKGNDPEVHAVEFLYMQKGSSLAMCVFDFRERKPAEPPEQAICFVDLYEGK